MKKALFLLLLCFNFIFADDYPNPGFATVISSGKPRFATVISSGKPIVISSGKPPATPTSEGSTYVCGSNSLTKTIPDVVKYFECLTEKTLRDYKIHTSVFAQRQNPYHFNAVNYYVKINGTIYEADHHPGSPDDASSFDPKGEIVCSIVFNSDIEEYVCGHIRTYYGNYKFFNYWGLSGYDPIISVKKNPNAPLNFPFKEIDYDSTLLFNKYCKPGEKLNTDNFKCVAPCDASKGEFWSDELNQCTFDRCETVANKNDRHNCFCIAQGLGKFKEKKVDYFIPSISEGGVTLKYYEQCTLQCEHGSLSSGFDENLNPILTRDSGFSVNVGLDPTSFCTFDEIQDPNATDKRTMTDEEFENWKETAAKMPSYEEGMKKDYCQDPEKIESLRSEMLADPTLHTKPGYSRMAFIYNKYCNANIPISPLNKENETPTQNDPQTDPSQGGSSTEAPSNPSQGGSSTEAPSNPSQGKSGSSGNPTSTVITGGNGSSGGSANPQQDPSTPPNPNEGKTDPISGSTSNDPFNNNNPAVRTGEGSTQGSTQSGEQGGQPEGSAEGSQGGSATGGLEGQTGGQGKGDGTSATGGEGEGNSQTGQGGEGQGEGEGNSDEGGNFGEIGFNVDKLEKIETSINSKSDSFLSSFIDTYTELETFLTSFKTGVENAKKEIEAAINTPIKHKAVTTCQRSFDLSIVSVNIDLCDILSRYSAVIYTVLFLSILIAGLGFFLRLVTVLLPALSSK